MDLEKLFDDEDDTDSCPWAPLSDTSIPSPERTKTSELGKNRPWIKLIDEEIAPKKRTIFSNIHLSRISHSRTERAKSSPKTVVEKAELPWKSEEKVDKGMNPPVVEVIRHHRRQASDSNSEISTLSGSKYNSLECSLETELENGTEDKDLGLKGNAPREQKQGYGCSTTLKRSTSPRCLILLTDPSKMIFEIVAVPYQAEKTTVGEMLSQLHQEATDYRLARQNYTGLVHQGMHVCAPMVPLDILLEAASRGRPLFAIPENYSAYQIEHIGNNLLQTPQVATLLEVQLQRFAASMRSPSPLPHTNDWEAQFSKSSTMNTIPGSPLEVFCP